jgi:hypothetical protein
MLVLDEETNRINSTAGGFGIDVHPLGALELSAKLPFLAASIRRDPLALVELYAAARHLCFVHHLKVFPRRARVSGYLPRGPSSGRESLWEPRSTRPQQPPATGTSRSI